MIPGLSTAKLIGFGLGALAVLAFIALALHWKHEMTARGEQLATICAATRSASNQPKLDCKQVPKQIEFMGEAITALSHSLKVQDEAVAALGEKTKQQQAESAAAIKAAQTRSGKAQATSERLNASSRSGEAQAKPCAPSKALTDAWR